MKQGRCSQCRTRFYWNRDVTYKQLIRAGLDKCPECWPNKFSGFLSATTHYAKPSKPHPSKRLWKQGVVITEPQDAPQPEPQDKGKPRWAVCKACHQEMVPGGGCTVHHEFDGKKRIPYEDPEGAVCHDCNVGPGNYHHMGCDWERCAYCGIGQALGCECEGFQNMLRMIEEAEKQPQPDGGK